MMTVQFARHQLANLKQHRSQYLQPIGNAKTWNSIAHSGGIYQLYYHSKHQHWEAYQFANSVGRLVRASTILTIYEARGSHTYQWFCPDIDAIATERNFNLLNIFLSQDILHI
jgi:hypothetical protein